MLAGAPWEDYFESASSGAASSESPDGAGLRLDVIRSGVDLAVSAARIANQLIEASGLYDRLVEQELQLRCTAGVQNRRDLALDEPAGVVEHVCSLRALALVPQYRVEDLGRGQVLGQLNPRDRYERDTRSEISNCRQ